MTAPLNIDCVLVKCDVLGDWYTLERAEHDGREWVEENGEERIAYGPVNMWCRSARLEKYTCVEGTAAEWRAIAAAIEANDSAEFRRCAAERTEHGYLFYSPRNTKMERRTLLSCDAAKRVAAIIRQTLGGTP